MSKRYSSTSVERYKKRAMGRRVRRLKVLLKPLHFLTILYSLVRHKMSQLAVARSWFAVGSRGAKKQISFRRRDQIFVDASFRRGGGRSQWSGQPHQDGKSGNPGGSTIEAGIGVWVPRLRLAFAISVQAKGSLEAEALALLAGALAAEKLGITEYDILSDCQLVVDPVARFMKTSGRLDGDAVVGRKESGLARHKMRKGGANHWVLGAGSLGRLFWKVLHVLGSVLALASESESRTYAPLYALLQKGDGRAVWLPREKNSEADLLSNIASRFGTTVINVPRHKEPKVILEALLSLALAQNNDTMRATGVVQHTRGRSGARSVSMPDAVPLGHVGFRRQASLLMGDLLSKVG